MPPDVRHWTLAFDPSREDHVNAALRAAEAAEAAEQTVDLAFSPVVFGLAGFGALIALLLVTYAFRSVGTRHR